MKRVKIIPLKNPITAEVTLPGSLSYTIRALNIAALTKGKVKITSPLKSDDTSSMVNSLRTLGISIDEGKDYLEVKGDISDIKNDTYELNIGLSGRTARTLLATLCVVPGIKILTCDEGFKKRPVKDLVNTLLQLGAKIEYLGKEGFLPVKITSSTLKPGKVNVEGTMSSQYISALLMITPIVGDLEIDVAGEQSSKPFIDITIDVMNTFGITVINDNYKKYSISGGNYNNPKKYEIEGDATAASYFLAIAALTKSKIKILPLSPNSKQGDARFADVLEKMGAHIEKNEKESSITVQGTDHLNGIAIDMNDNPDIVQTLAVVATFAKGETKITEISHLRVKETDRITATKNELKKMGGEVEATDDSLTIHQGTPHGAVIETYRDHRMAMAFSVAGTKIPGVEIIDPDVVDKSFPDFWKELNSIGIKTENIGGKNIVLIGMRGSGKTTIAKLLAKKLDKKYLELDAMLVEKAKMSISEIVEKYGWDHFRVLESELVQEVSKFDDIIVSTGGGVVVRKENIDALKKNGLLVFLQAPIDMLVKRLEAHPDLPALTNKKTRKEELEEILKERLPLYQQAADETIDTDRLSAQQVADIIASKNYN